jgi:signal transduction histidine kinase
LSDPKLPLYEKWALAEEVVSVMRHDVRNRLAAIRSAAYYVGRRVRQSHLLDSDARLGVFLQLIDDELAAADRSLADGAMRYVSRTPSRLRVGTCVERAVASISRPAGVGLELKLADTALLDVEPTEITLLVRCLVDNAIDATGAGGVVTVETSDGDGGVALRVTDTGMGTSESLETALDPFVTEKPGHPGIGLNIARRIAERHGGRLSLRARSPGVEVEVSLPVAGAGAP